MNDEIKRYLYDIKIAITSIFSYLGDKQNFFEYQKNKLLRRGIEREFEIIGEAVNRILKKDTTIIITNARRIVQTRNLIIHNYDTVDDTIIWGIISKDLPKLKTEINKLLNDDTDKIIDNK